MHNAPLVKYPVGRFAWGTRLAVLLGGLAMGLPTALYLQDQIRPVWAGVSVACVVLAALLWSRRALRTPFASAWLVWDGQGWQRWSSADGDVATPLGACSVLLDGQRVLLLHFPNARTEQGFVKAQWVWLYKGFAPAQWHGLRCAVYSA